MRNTLLFFLTIAFVGCNSNEPSTPKVTGISYLVDEINVGLGNSATSGVPTVVGAAPYTFSISAITSIADNHLLDPSAITINSTNGVINLLENNLLPIGEYDLDIAVANGGGTEIFANAFKYIISNIPKNLVYNPQVVDIKTGQAYNTLAPTISGGEPVTYVITNSTEIGTFISIDSNTGIISIDGQSSSEGENNIDVQASNLSGSALFENALEVNITVAVPTEEEVQTALLAKSWAVTTGANSVSLDGQDEDGNWDGFTVNFSENGTYTSSNVSVGREVVWPTSGTWAFKGTTGADLNTIIRGDGVNIDITLSETALSMRFNYTEPGGRTSGVEGDWVFNMER